MTAATFLMLVSLLAGCGGGSGGGDPIPGGDGGSTNYAPSLTADQPDPQRDDITLSSAVVLGEELTVNVDVTETDGIGSASVEITYDPQYVEFVDWSGGELLPPCGLATLCLVGGDLPGRLVIGMATTGSGNGYDAYQTETLIRLTFRAIRQGASRLDFDTGVTALQDPDLNEITGLAWHGGTVITH